MTPGGYLLDTHIEMITLDGNLQMVGYGEFKALCFASEKAPADLFSSFNLFERRPKAPGLWGRFTFCDGDVLDGLLSHNLLEWPSAGFLIVPPKAGAARQRVFIPRAALRTTEIKGVVGGSPPIAAAKRKPARSVEGDSDQLTMFD